MIDHSKPIAEIAQGTSPMTTRPSTFEALARSVLVWGGGALAVGFVAWLIAGWIGVVVLIVAVLVWLAGG